MVLTLFSLFQEEALFNFLQGNRKPENILEGPGALTFPVNLCEKDPLGVPTYILIHLPYPLFKRWQGGIFPWEMKEVFRAIIELVWILTRGT